MSRTYWVTLCFNTFKDFNKPLSLVTYDNSQIEIKRGSSTEGHELYIQTTEDEKDKAYKKAFRFLSELAWLFDTSIEVLERGGGSRKISFNVSNMTFNRVSNCIDLDNYQQVAFDNNQKLALGIYREGLSSNSKFYAFLSYFKIINILYRTASDQINWINSNIGNLPNSTLLQVLTKKGITDFGDQLYKSGRCAIAHACILTGDPIADADNINDIFRISEELPLIKEFANIFIRNELNVR